MHALSRRSLLPLVFSLAAAGPLTGCGGASYGPSKPVVVFPTAADVARIPSAKPPETAFGVHDAIADEWTFAEPPPSNAATYDDPTPWGPLLSGLVHGRGALAPSTAMRCAAAEVARFHASHQALPAEGLRRFIVAHCGATAPNVRPVVWYVDAPATVADKEIAAKAVPSMGKTLDGMKVRGRGLVGASAARDGTHVSVVAMVADEELRLAPGARMVDANGQVALEGTVTGPYEQVTALVTRGEAGYAVCKDAQRAEHFGTTCGVAADDDYAWVQILGRQRGQMLMSPLADVLVYRKDPATVAYHAKKYGPSAPVGTPAELVTALERGVNLVRTANKLAPVKLSPPQSAENERLAGALLSASLSDDGTTENQIALGLLAGWKVSGLVRSADVLVAAVGPTRDAEAWLELALERPIGRMTLLDPDARAIAIGPALLDGVQGVGAAVTTYAFFEGDDASAATRFYTRLAAARSARSHATVRIPAAADTLAQIDAVRAQAKPAMSALEDAMSAFAASGRSVRGWVFETNDLDKGKIPDELLDAASSQTIVAVTHHRAPGAAWGQYVVFVLFLDGLQEAALPSTPSVRTAMTHPLRAE